MSLYLINSLQPSGYFAVPPGWTLQNSTFCPNNVFMCSEWF